ncbi:hypothetical protein PTKIN_Ptkin07bG0045200 [Pterospermum kingtungense]
MRTCLLIEIHESFLNLYSSLTSFFCVKQQNYNAKLCDFGLAKNRPTGDRSHVFTRVMGQYDCATPQYMATGIFLNCHLSHFLAQRFGHLIAISDVYGFGVLLEMLIGKPALDKNKPFAFCNAYL